jgi:hypothetical protein
MKRRGLFNLQTGLQSRRRRSRILEGERSRTAPLSRLCPEIVADLDSLSEKITHPSAVL